VSQATANVFLAVLNTFQTIALAWLAAAYHYNGRHTRAGTKGE
jgi:hypothetical protein